MLYLRKLVDWLKIFQHIILLMTIGFSIPLSSQTVQSEDIIIVPKLVLDQRGFSGDIAVSPADGSVHVIWVHDRKIYYQIRTPEGSWLSREIIPNNDIPVHAEEGKKTPKNARKCVGITIDEQGIIHIVFTSRYGPLNYMYGQSGDWSSPIVIAPKGHPCILPDVVELNGDIFACFHDSDDPEKPEVYTVSRINGKWKKMRLMMIGDYPSLAVGDNGMVYFLHREFQYVDKHNARFAYYIPGLQGWTYNYDVTNAERRLGIGPGMTVGNGNIYVAWNNSTGIEGSHKSEMFCAVAKEPGLEWTPHFGKAHDSPLFYENTGDPHPRLSVYSDSTVLYINSRRLLPGYLVWNGNHWGNHLKGPWVQGVVQTACDGKTVWVVASSSLNTNEEVSVTGLTNPYALRYDFENHKPIFSSEPPTGAVKNQMFEYLSHGSDSDGDEVTYSLTFYPDGMTIDSETGLIQWIPSEEEESEVIVGVKIADPKGRFSTQYFKLEVVDGPLVAEFSADTLLGEAPFTVQFSDLSLGTIDAWLWNFGNGESSTEQNPQITYTASGQFTVQLTVTGPGGSSVEIKDNYVTVGDPPPVSGFDADVHVGFTPLTVQFTDTSIGDITSWHWDFGDGGISSQQNPIHIYSNTGIYTVGLKVTGPSGSDSTSSVDYITVLEPPPVAGFRVDTSSGERPFTVQFTDTSKGLISTWNWNFGDGQTSAEQNPNHTYFEPGNYSIQLDVSGPGGDSSVEKTDYILVLATPFRADFGADPIDGETPLAVQFQDLTAGKTMGWQWYFGDTYSPDGGTSTEQNPVYTYTHAGAFTVILTVQGFDTSATVIKHNLVTVTDGTFVLENTQMPDQFYLNQNYPNPFNGETLIEYGLPDDSEVHLTIYDMRGTLITRFEVEHQKAGVHFISWNGCNNNGQPISSGLYLFQLRAGSFQAVMKMLMLK